MAHGGTQNFFDYILVNQLGTFFLVIIKDEYLTFEKGIILKLQEKIAMIEKRGLEKSKRE